MVAGFEQTTLQVMAVLHTRITICGGMSSNDGALAYDFHRPGRYAQPYVATKPPCPYTQRVDKKADQDKLDALVGAALKGLVEAEASPHAIGRFAASYRQEAAEILGLVESQPQAPDLQQLVTTAVAQALEEAGVVKGATSTRAKNRRPAPMRRVYVSIQGKRTSLTIPAQDVERAAEQKGGEVEARQFIEALAQTIPPGVENRSKWVRDHLALALAEPATPQNLSRH